MIPRYSRPEMAAVWAPETRFAIWLEIERHVLDAQVALGQAPQEAADALDRAMRAHADALVDPEKIDAIERETRHDVIAFLTNLANHVGPEARFIHQGLTSSDVLDTCLAVQFDRAGALLAGGVDAVAAALKRRAFEHKGTLCVGRSHGVHAEPTSFGLKLAGHYAEFARAAERLQAARREIATCAISGPVGTFASVDPAVEAHVAERMGLAPEPVSTQVIPRDRHAMYFAVLGVVAGAIERLAVEIRHLQRSEVGEAAEAFGKGQKGSSAMPHKKNPILSENLTGLARIVRASVTPALENIALWHERDISHSAVERVFAPDATIALDFALTRLAGVVDGLVVDEAAMRRNLDSRGGLVYSQRVLLALIERGMSREEAYAVVQEIALGVWEGGGDFEVALAADARVAAALDRAALTALFEPGPYLEHVDTIFARVFGHATNEATDSEGSGRS
ncbi:MAG: adenylosuccinate lyase [Rhodospirillales bacterium]|nr:adenylosuccinate lyase [Rhodospirillales bacterium]MDE0379943.1 adenylosuccinate lyase [Rhodospirillales bacterium]